MYLLSLGCEYRNGFPEGARAIGGYDYKSKKIVIKVLNGMGGTFLRYRTKHLEGFRKVVLLHYMQFRIN